MTIEAVRVAAQLLELVALHGPIGVSELSRKSNVPKATAQRMMTTWGELGWARKEDAKSALWSITGKMVDLGLKYDNRGNLKETAHPFMQELSENTGGETVHLVVKDGLEVLLIERVEGTKPVRTHYPLGGSSPLNATATGLAILSCYPEEEIRSIFGEKLPWRTEHTIVDIEELLKMIEEGREHGYFRVEGGNHPETSAIAASIKARGRVVGAISISLPTARVTDELAESYGASVREVAARISAILG